MRSLLKQTSTILNDIGTHKSIRKRINSAYHPGPIANQIYKIVYKLEWVNIYHGRSRNYGQNVHYALDRRACAEDKDFDTRALVGEFSPPAHLDACFDMTESDLAFLIAFCDRYITHVERVSSLAPSPDAPKFKKQIMALRDVSSAALKQMTTM
jgi:hypothetical protein